MKIDKELDCLGLYCPEPIFRTRMALDQMEKGQVLKVVADDPAAEEDLKRLSERLGHEVLEIEKGDEQVILYIKK
ncbi:hypothetical protein GF319_05925 [Candidatus Bathyarchaeota archaeon]|jgi:TusA-related sulfurtransferase|nr:hypothetical protein [Candidatus Bathyarchaeota archaeon]